LATQRGVPPYIIFGDVTLRHMAREYPTSLVEFGLLHGVGEKKLNEFGEQFTRVVAAYLEANEKRTFKEV
jgi:ATP-dependent DNA helicase RecQ